MGYKRTAFIITKPAIRVLDNISGIKKYSGNYICAPNGILPHMQYCIVFGARIRADHSVSQILQERLDKAIEVGIDRMNIIFLLTGIEDEVAAMKEYMQAKGEIPEDRILCDTGGYTTYQSLLNARDKFGIATAMAVSNSFHLPRCVFIGRKLGMQIWGVEISPKNVDRRQRYEEYESLARIKAWLQTKLPGRN